jgi:hypothetical protein
VILKSSYLMHGLLFVLAIASAAPTAADDQEPLRLTIDMPLPSSLQSVKHAELTQPQLLNRFPRLKTVVLTGGPIDDAVIKTLAKLKRLESVVFDSVDVSEQQINNLRELRPKLRIYRSQRLAVVRLRNVGYLDNTAVIYNQETLPEAQRIILDGDEQRLQRIYGMKLFERASKFRYKTDIEESYHEMTADEMMDIRFLTTLIRVDLSNIQFTPESLRCLIPLTKLKHLALPIRDINDTAIGVFSQLKSLETIECGVGSYQNVDSADVQFCLSLAKALPEVKVRSMTINKMMGLPIFSTLDASKIDTDVKTGRLKYSVSDE